MNKLFSGSTKLLQVAATTLLAILICSPSFAQDGMDRDSLLTGAQWDSFNRNLVYAINNGNEGEQEGALVQIAMYGDYLEFPELTVFEVMRIYREHDDPQIRRLAVVALGNMNSNWAIEFLDMLSEYEKDETIQSTMNSIVAANR